jgi:stage V sporulation protein D (sporulation-specific penicillin-binding protein)
MFIQELQGGMDLAAPSLGIKKRLLFMLAVFALIVVVLMGRLAYIQFVQGTELQKKAYKQQNTGRTISPIRGTIFDRNGKKLAISVQVATITCNPNEIGTKNAKLTADEIADGLAPLLSMDRNEIKRLITKKTNYVTIKRKVDEATEDGVRKWISAKNVRGINIDEDSKRYYPNSNLLSHVLGFTGDDNQGLMGGVEDVMEKYLKGVPGKILSEVDAKGRAVPSDTEKRIDAQDGLNVVLTIDQTIQYLASKTLEKAIEDYKVKQGGVAIVLDPKTGDILALVSKPDYDLNNPYALPKNLPESIAQEDIANWVAGSTKSVNILSKTVWRDKAISDTYEPGSTFKTITTSAGLEEGLVTPETITNDMPIKVAGWPKPIYCWRKGREHGTETFREAVVNSCNPAFVKVAQSLGISRFYGYVRAFGFNDKTGIDLKGESKSIFQANKKEIDMAVASFGQRFTITPIQLATAYTAVVNGGKLMKPRLVKELTDSEGNIVKKFEPEVVRTVLSQQTSDTVRSLLESVVSTPNGTGNGAYVKGYRIAGKTGTSETTQKDVHIASFCGFAPADDPQIITLVVLFDPKGESYMGGQIAAPTAGKIMEDVLNYLQVERKYTEEDLKAMTKEVLVPEVRKATVEDAVNQLKKAGLNYRIEGNGNNKSIVMEQTPKPDALVPEKSMVILYTYKPEQEVTVAMPDLKNKSMSEAIDAMNRIGLNIRVSGKGVVFRQEYPEGTMLEKGRVVEVSFRNIDNIE